MAECAIFCGVIRFDQRNEDDTIYMNGKIAQFKLHPCAIKLFSICMIEKLKLGKKMHEIVTIYIQYVYIYRYFCPLKIALSLMFNVNCCSSRLFCCDLSFVPVCDETFSPSLLVLFCLSYYKRGSCLC